ncbi:MAG: NAD(P)H-dependent oxidoreductase [Bacilli bacterium]|nr:NAD(P)H-dependent oxidoreductase [Bacilli bacterium]
MIIYFSRADENYNVGYIDKGNTEVIAEYIKEITNADMFKVEPLVPYSKDYMTCIEEAKLRTNTHDAPIKESIPDITSYEVIYIGTPIYWGGMPEELITALKEVDFNKKIIRPFVTHEGSGLSTVPSQLESICKGAIIMEGIAIQGSIVRDSKPKIEEWV